MTTVDTPNFDSLRRDATRTFAQTMIIVDDEASLEPEALHSQPAGKLRSPSRKTSLEEGTADSAVEQNADMDSGQRRLNAKLLIDNAMELGLLCSVLRPKRGENFRRRVVEAAQVADIVCLDWEIYKDGGDAASKIIAAIIREDAKQNGRLRTHCHLYGEQYERGCDSRRYTQSDS